MPRKSVRANPRAARIPDQVLAAVLGQPWAITPQGLELVLAVVSRGTLTPNALEQADGRPLDETRTTTIRDGVALVPVNGPLVARASWLDEMCGATSYSTIVKDVSAALDNPEVRAIVLQIASPGGQVHGCGEAAKLLAEARGRKPLLAFVEGDACSAAYWLASACDEVIAAESAVLGCLGVQVAYLDDQRWLEQNGLREVIITSSQTPAKNRAPTDDAGVQAYQQLVDDLATVFLDQVAANRGVSRADVDARFGQGAVLVGARAVRAGLADRLSTYEQLHAELLGGTWQSPRAVPATMAADASSASSSSHDLPMKRTARQQVAATAAADNAGEPQAAAFESGTEVRSRVTRDVSIAEGDLGTIVDILDGTVYAVQFGDGESSTYRYLAEADLEAAPAADPSADPATDPATDPASDPNAPPPAARQTIAQRLRIDGANAERVRITGILALAKRGVTAEQLQPLIDDATCTPEAAAHRLLTGAVRSAAAGGLLARLAGDEAALTTAGLSAVADGAPAQARANPIVAAMRVTNPRALVDDAAHSARSTTGA